jgi:hypothetical protein
VSLTRRLFNSPTAVILTISLVWTVLNAMKAVHIDDEYFMFVGRHVAQHPTDPFGFQSFWYEWPEPGFWVVMPMVLPYWLALPTTLFWNNPFIIKLWMLPFAFAFAWSVHALLRRFVGKHEVLLLLAIVFSPAFLPSINIMLDIPAMGLALLALELFLRGLGGPQHGHLEQSERSGAVLPDDQSRVLRPAQNDGARRIALIVFAGLIAGVAMQTKYSVLSLPIVFLIYGVLFKRLPRAILACVAAGLVFWGWEGFLFARYGQSHFLTQLQLDDPISTQPRLRTWASLPAFLGGAIPMLVFLACAALRWRKRALQVALIAMPIGYFGLVSHATGRIFFTLLAVVILFAIGKMLWMRARSTARIDRVTWFLVAWIGVEIFIAMKSSLFGGERRVFGIAIACVFVLARLCFTIENINIPNRLLRWATAASVAIAAIFFATDLDEGLAWKDAVAESIESVRKIAPEANIWYAGHWGIDYYAPMLGAKPLIPDETTIRKGDWLLLFIGVHRPTMVAPLETFDAYVVPAKFNLPWSMTSSFYGGDAPIEWRQGENRVWLLRARFDVLIRSSYAEGNIIEIIEHRRQFTPDAAFPAIVTRLKTLGGDELLRARRAIEGIGPRAVIYTLQHAEPANRAWAATRLGEQSTPADADIRDALKAAEADPDDAVRKAAADALQKLQASSSRRE